MNPVAERNVSDREPGIGRYAPPESRPVLRLIETVRRHVRALAAFVGGTTLLSAALSLALPEWYASGASFTVDAAPTPAAGGLGMLGLASQLGIAGLGGGSASAQYYADVLASNTVIDRVALGRIVRDSAGTATPIVGAAGALFTPRQRDRARRRLREHLGVSVNARTSMISFTIEGRTPIQAEAAADTMLAALSDAILDLRRRRAGAERRFVEARLDSAVRRQFAAEDSLRHFYLANRLTNSPNLQFAEARLRRGAEFAQELTNQLRVQLEQAKLQEVRDTPVLSVIESPERPGRRSRPNRRLIVLAGLSLSLLAAGAWVAVRAGALALRPA